MLYKTNDGKMVEIVRSSYTDDKSYYVAIMKAKGILKK
jgi:hypothetical protein